MSLPLLGNIFPVDPDANEAAVEVRVIWPLLALLGYETDDIAPKMPIVFRQGTKGRKPEADFVVYCGLPHGPSTSAIVVEAKRPGEDLVDARDQAISYARVVNAPFVLVCDGFHCQLWHLPFKAEFELVCTFELNDVQNQFSNLEQRAGKQALIQYARDAQLRWALPEPRRFEAYVKAELARTIRYADVIERRLAPLAAGDGEGIIAGDQVLNEASGAVIVARSGMGKTSLGMRLFRSALAEHERTSGEVVPFHVNLPELRGRSLIEFVFEHFRASRPTASVHLIESIFRDHSAVLICDAFDQVRERRDDLANELRGLLRRFPRLRLIILSRLTAAPTIDLPTLELLPLDGKEQYAIAGNEMIGNLGRASGVMSRLCSIPLILQMLIRYCLAHDQQPKDLPQLFEEWLDHVLLVDKASPARRERYVRALRKLATSDGPLRLDTAVDILMSAGFDPEILDELAQRDAIEMDGQTISFSHESQRDYLQALDISRNDAARASISIGKITMDADSLLPLFLMVMLPTPELRRELWTRFGEIPLPLVSVTLSYVIDTDYEKECNPDGLEDYLNGVADGAELALERFFPQLRKTLTRLIVGADCDQLRAVGEADQKTYLVAVMPRSGDQPKVSIEKVVWDADFTRSESGRGPLTLSNGHAKGLGLVASAALAAIKQRELPGRLHWRAERASGWLRALSTITQFRPSNSTLITELLAAMQKHRAYRGIYSSGSLTVRPGDIERLCSDLESLLALGLHELPHWQARPMTDWDIKEVPNQAVPNLLDEHFHKSQLIYRELVEEGFQSIAGSLGHYNLFPVRAQVEITMIQGERSARTSWLPVARWEECGADVSERQFNSKGPSVREMFDKLSFDLRRVRRDPEKAATYFTGWGRLPGGTGSLQYDHTRESVCLREACNWLRRDFEALFRELRSALRHGF